MKKVSTNKGFTLIELLVVVAIIGLLSSIILSSLDASRKKSRDAIRRQDLVQLRTALEIYRLNVGQYPYDGTGSFDQYTSNPGGGMGFSDNAGDWIPGLVASGAISKLPQDPTGGLSTNPTCTPSSYYRSFLYFSNGTHYKLIAECSLETTWSNTDAFYDPHPRATYALSVEDNNTLPPGSVGVNCNPAYVFPSVTLASFNYPACI